MRQQKQKWPATLPWCTRKTRSGCIADEFHEESLLPDPSCPWNNNDENKKPNDEKKEGKSGNDDKQPGSDKDKSEELGGNNDAGGSPGKEPDKGGGKEGNGGGQAGDLEKDGELMHDQDDFSSDDEGGGVEKVGQVSYRKMAKPRMWCHLHLAFMCFPHAPRSVFSFCL